jgi:uncharacterized protein HemX
MNEQQFGGKIREVLNQAKVDAGTAERLRAARERALERQRREPAPALQWADNVLGRLGGWSGASLRLVAPMAVLALGLAGIYAWQQSQRAAEAAEIDMLLLGDELPIDAYLDRGFQNWLKKRAADRKPAAEGR